MAISVNVGDIDFVTADAAVKQDGVPFGVWNDYQVRTHYWYDPHRWMVGITSPGGFQGASCAFVQLAAATELWVADWVASRFNTVPYLPDYDLRDPNWVFLGWKAEPTQLSLSPDNSPLYTIAGTYVYGRRNPKENMGDVIFPKPAWMDDAFSRTIPTGTFQQGIITAPGGGRAGGGAAPGIPGSITRTQ